MRRPCLTLFLWEQTLGILDFAGFAHHGHSAVYPPAARRLLIGAPRSAETWSCSVDSPFAFSVTLSTRHANNRTHSASIFASVFTVFQFRTVLTVFNLESSHWFDSFVRAMPFGR